MITAPRAPYAVALCAVLALAASCKARQSSAVKDDAKTDQQPQDGDSADPLDDAVEGPHCGGTCTADDPIDSELADMLMPVLAYQGAQAVAMAGSPTDAAPQDQGDNPASDQAQANDGFALAGGALATTEQRDAELAKMEQELKAKQALIAKKHPGLEYKSIDCSRSFESRRHVQTGQHTQAKSGDVIKEYAWKDSDSGTFKVRAFYRARPMASVRTQACSLATTSAAQPYYSREHTQILVGASYPTKFVDTSGTDEQVLVSPNCDCTTEPQTWGIDTPNLNFNAFTKDKDGSSLYIAQVLDFDWYVPFCPKKQGPCHEKFGEAKAWCEGKGYRLPEMGELLTINAALNKYLTNGAPNFYGAPTMEVRNDRPYLWTSAGRDDYGNWMMFDWKEGKPHSVYEGTLNYYTGIGYDPLADYICIR